MLRLGKHNRRPFNEGPEECRMCSGNTMRRPTFFEAFPNRDGGRAGFTLDEGPPVPSWRMTECSNCGGIQPTPYPAADEVADFYRTADEPSEWEVEHYVRIDLNPKAISGTRRLAEQFTRLNNGPGRLLELGCASGWTLKAARELGWDVVGIEAAPKFASFARDELGLDIIENVIENIDVHGIEPFDVIAGFDVFEHLHDPAGSLRTLRKLAHGNTRLLMTTPWISSWCARLYGVNWRQILPSHINFSTASSMVAILERTGWQLSALSEPRYWDPDPRVERRQQWKERAKFAARAALVPTVVKPATRFPALQTVPAAVTRGRLSWTDFTYRVGDQPVLGDVMFVVASPDPTTSSA